LYFIRKNHAEQTSRPPTPEQQPPAAACGSVKCHSHSPTPNISITVNGERACTDTNVQSSRPDSEDESKSPPESPTPCFYRIYRDKAEQYRWQLKVRAMNKEDGVLVDEIIATSHQGFPTPEMCFHEILRVMECCHARIEHDLDNDGNSTVIAPRTESSLRRRTPFVDRTNVLRQDLLSNKIFNEK